MHMKLEKAKKERVSIKGVTCYVEFTEMHRVKDLYGFGCSSFRNVSSGAAQPK